MNNFLIVLLGPKGVGKSDIAVEIASHFGIEIISSDSRQFYREMTIGTAVPEPALLARVKHHFIQFISIRDYYSSSLYERDVLALLPSLFNRSGAALMTGGSGLYIDAVCRGIDDIPDTDPAVRKKLNEKYRAEGIESLRTDLRLTDPDYYSRVDLRNHQRIIRALEIFESTGRKYSEFLTHRNVERDFSIIKVGLVRERKELYERINSRLDRMMEDGLEEEARGLFELRGLSPLKSVGYSELFDFFEGRISRERAIELIKRNSRRYAKRQMTWWNRDSGITWFHPGNISEIISHIERETGR
jgi:tRNA dimethylallyltransferase